MVNESDFKISNTPIETKKGFEKLKKIYTKLDSTKHGRAFLMSMLNTILAIVLLSMFPSFIFIFLFTIFFILNYLYQNEKEKVDNYESKI